MLVQDIMTKHPITIEASASLGMAIQRLQNVDIHHLPVTRDGQLVGMLSDRGLRNCLHSIENKVENPYKAQATFKESVTAAMTPDPVVVEETMDLTAAIDEMLKHKLSSLPVIEEGTGKLTGILSYIDILAAFRNSLKHKNSN